MQLVKGVSFWEGLRLGNLEYFVVAWMEVHSQVAWMMVVTF